MRLEAAFFSEQPGLPKPPAIGILVVDFDETCTAGDTTGVIINAAIAEAERSAGGVHQGLQDFMSVVCRDAAHFSTTLVLAGTCHCYLLL